MHGSAWIRECRDTRDLLVKKSLIADYLQEQFREMNIVFLRVTVVGEYLLTARLEFGRRQCFKKNALLVNREKFRRQVQAGSALYIQGTFGMRNYSVQALGAQSLAHSSSTL